MKPSILSINQAQWQSLFQEHEGTSKSFRVQQLFQHIYLRGSLEPQTFSDFPNATREWLAENFMWEFPQIDTALMSQDGSEKMLLKLADGLFTECVIMPSDNRITLCISSQVGCRMGCTFCQTGRMGLSRNLTSGEILVQLTMANLRLQGRGETRKVTNVVFMGMGEPLDNYDAVVGACRNMIDKKMFGLSKHKVTVSTSGLVPEIRRLGHDVPVALAISLHSTDNAERSSMMPVNKTYPLEDLKKALLEYPLHTRHGITFEYVMIAGKNDSLTHAKKLVRFLHGLQAKVNLIPMNPHPGSSFEASCEDNLRNFQQYLFERSIPAPIRRSRGPDVSGACGQLAAKRKDELHLTPRQTARARRAESKLTAYNANLKTNISKN